MEQDEDKWDWGRLHALATRETRRVLRDDQLAEDAAQEAVIRAWRMRAKCRTAWAPDAWVAQIARREALRSYRRLARQRRREAWLDIDERDADLPGRGGVPDPVDLDVRKAVRLLPRADRELMTLRYAFELTQPEVAEALGVPEGTAKIRLHRARARLRALLAT